MKRLVMIAFTLFSACSEQCHNYMIRDIDLSPISIKYVEGDSNALFSAQSDFCLLTFKPEYTNCHHSFSPTAYQSGMDGIEDSIARIEVLDSGLSNITDKFIGPGQSSKVCYLVDSSNEKENCFIYKSIYELQQRINAKEQNEVGVRIESPRLFYLPENIRWPIYFKMYYKTDSIIKKIDIKKRTIKSYAIQIY